MSQSLAIFIVVFSIVSAAITYYVCEREYKASVKTETKSEG
jgi:hypothetical protein